MQSTANTFSINLIISIALLLAHTFNSFTAIHPASASAAVPGFTIVSKQTFIPRGQTQAQSQALIMRAQRNDGSFKLVTTYLQPDVTTASISSAFGYAGVGIFRLDEAHHQLIFFSPLELAPALSTEEALRQDHRFVREETVLGYHTLVLKEQLGSTNSYQEQYYAPELQGVIIKSVTVSDEGTEVIEPTKIETTEPSPQEFLALYLYPINFHEYDEKIRVQESKGNKEMAQLMRRRLERAQQWRRT